MKLIGLPVFTDAGDRVGTVVGLEYDENNQIRIYVIRRPGILGIFRKRVLIYPSMVILVDDKKMIVKGPEIKIKEPVMAVGAT